MRALRVWYAIFNAAVATSLSIDYRYRDIPTKTKIELTPVTASCSRNDIIRLSAPLINEETLYYLHNPNGDVTELDLPSPDRNRTKRDEGNSDSVRQSVEGTMVYSLTKSKILVDDIEAEMHPNEFLLGPVFDEDHGNWLLSIYTKDYNDEWIELFQVITINIVEVATLTPMHSTLKEGSTYHLRFIIPIPNLESCQLIAPSSTHDRFYTRDENIDSCGYMVPNITKEDEGIWGIEAVGNIVYEGTATLYVRQNRSKR